MITMENVCKSYKVAKRNAGFGEAWKALFRREYETIHALRNVSFTIEDGEPMYVVGRVGSWYKVKSDATDDTIYYTHVQNLRRYRGPVTWG